jgi:hypothetical protein
MEAVAVSCDIRVIPSSGVRELKIVTSVKVDVVHNVQPVQRMDEADETHDMDPGEESQSSTHACESP